MHATRIAHDLSRERRKSTMYFFINRLLVSAIFKYTRLASRSLECLNGKWLYAVCQSSYACWQLDVFPVAIHCFSLSSLSLSRNHIHARICSLPALAFNYQ
jgi:hypothetical protein